MLWLCGIATPTCLIAAHFYPGGLKTLLVVAGVLPIVAAVIGFACFAVFSPSRLQSEDFQIRQQLLHLIQQKGGRLTVDTISPDAIANPRGADDRA
jgi:hypothetical protein